MKDWWTVGLTKEQAADFREAYSMSKPVLDRLAQRLQKELKDLDTSIDSFDFLVLPSTKERLVAKLAERKKIKQILRILEA